MKYLEHKHRQDILQCLPSNAVCAELGVYMGRFASMIIRFLKPKRLYLVDPYWKIGSDAFWGKDSHEQALSSAIGRLKKWDNDNVAVMVIDFDFLFLKDLPDKFFDWVFLDSTHMYEDTLKELEVIAPKIKDGGFIAGHDWHDNTGHKHAGVTKAICEWLEAHPEYELIIRDNFSHWILEHTPNKAAMLTCSEVWHDSM